jgi:hypothetical protein
MDPRIPGDFSWSILRVVGAIIRQLAGLIHRFVYGKRRDDLNERNPMAGTAAKREDSELVGLRIGLVAQSACFGSFVLHSMPVRDTLIADIPPRRRARKWTG